MGPIDTVLTVALGAPVGACIVGWLLAQVVDEVHYRRLFDGRGHRLPVMARQRRQLPRRGPAAIPPARSLVIEAAEQ